MGDETTGSHNNPQTVFRLEDLRKSKKDQNVKPLPVRIHVEVACREPVGKEIQDCATAAFESAGCLVVGNDKPDWILSVIAFSHGDLVELSIILRKLFRSTLPGTEVESVDTWGKARLRSGGWLYESLRFHGLFGVPKGELGPFLARLAKDFAVQHWDEQTHKKSSNN
jgi:hypothetical protein